MTITRRGLLRGITGLIAAPAIVRVSSLMPISVMPLDGGLTIEKILRATEIMDAQDAARCGFTVTKAFVQEFRRNVLFLAQQQLDELEFLPPT